MECNNAAAQKTKAYIPLHCWLCHVHSYCFYLAQFAASRNPRNQQSASQPAATSIITPTQIPTPQPTAVPSRQPTEMVNATIGQDITVDGMQWRVMEPKDAGNSLKRDKDGVKDYADAKAQGKFIWIRYQVTAKEGGGQITKNHIQVVDGAGNVYQGHESLEPSESLQLIRWLPEEESCPRDEQGFAVMQKSLKAGESYVCQEVFDVPTNATGIKVRVSNLAIVFKKYAFINLGF